MKKIILLSITFLLVSLNLFAQLPPTPGVCDVAMYDDFKSSLPYGSVTNYTGWSFPNINDGPLWGQKAYKAIYWWEFQNLNGSLARMDRDPLKGIGKYWITQPYGSFQPVGINCGFHADECNHRKFFTLDLSENAEMSFDITNGGDSLLGVSFQLQDINGITLSFDKTAKDEPTAYLYQIGFVNDSALTAHSSKHFTYDFKNAIIGKYDAICNPCLDKDTTHFDFKHVTQVVIVIANFNKNNSDGYKPYPLINYPVEFKNFKLGDVSKIANSSNLTKVLPCGFNILGKEIIPQNVAANYSVEPQSSNFTYQWRYTGKKLFQLIPDSSNMGNISVFANENTTSGNLICDIYTLENQLYHSIVKPITVNSNSEVYAINAIKCPPKRNDCSGNYIDKFTFGNLKNENTGCSSGGYSDYTASGLKADIVMGEVYNAGFGLVSIDEDTGSIKPSMYLGLWLDFNNDGDYEDENEFLGSSYTSEREVNLYNIHIPGNLNYIGQARLRVRLRATNSFSDNEACVTDMDNGETEDYMVNIKTPLGLEAPQAITPNNDGMNDLFVIKGINSKSTNNLVIIDALGNKVFEENDYKNNWPSLENTTLKKGSYYYLFTNGENTLKGFFVLNY